MTTDDDAAMREEHFRELALRNKRPEGPAACGQCLNCGEPLEGLRRWCDEDCREDWERKK